MKFQDYVRKKALRNPLHFLEAEVDSSYDTDQQVMSYFDDLLKRNPRMRRPNSDIGDITAKFWNDENSPKTGLDPDNGHDLERIRQIAAWSKDSARGGGGRLAAEPAQENPAQAAFRNAPPEYEPEPDDSISRTMSGLEGMNVSQRDVKRINKLARMGKSVQAISSRMELPADVVQSILKRDKQAGRRVTRAARKEILDMAKQGMDAKSIAFHVDAPGYIIQQIMDRAGIERRPDSFDHKGQELDYGDWQLGRREGPQLPTPDEDAAVDDMVRKKDLADRDRYTKERSWLPSSAKLPQSDWKGNLPSTGWDFDQAIGDKSPYFDGRRGSKQFEVTPQQRSEIERLHRQGATPQGIAFDLGIPLRHVKATTSQIQPPQAAPVPQQQPKKRRGWLW